MNDTKSSPDVLAEALRAFRPMTSQWRKALVQMADAELAADRAFIAMAEAIVAEDVSRYTKLSSSFAHTSSALEDVRKHMAEIGLSYRDAENALSNAMRDRIMDLEAERDTPSREQYQQWMADRFSRAED